MKNMESGLMSYMSSKLRDLQWRKTWSSGWWWRSNNLFQKSCVFYLWSSSLSESHYQDWDTHNRFSVFPSTRDWKQERTTNGAFRAITKLITFFISSDPILRMLRILLLTVSPKTTLSNQSELVWRESPSRSTFHKMQQKNGLLGALQTHFPRQKRRHLEIIYNREEYIALASP